MLARKIFPMANLLIQIDRTAAHKSAYALTEFHIKDAFEAVASHIRLIITRCYWSPFSTFPPSTRS